MYNEHRINIITDDIIEYIRTVNNKENSFLPYLIIYLSNIPNYMSVSNRMHLQQLIIGLAQTSCEINIIWTDITNSNSNSPYPYPGLPWTFVIQDHHTLNLGKDMYKFDIRRFTNGNFYQDISS